MQLCGMVSGFFCNMKGNRTFHDGVNKCSSKQQICNSALIVFMMRKTGLICLALVGLMAGMQAGRLKMGRFQNLYFY